MSATSSTHRRRELRILREQRDEALDGRLRRRRPEPPRSCGPSPRAWPCGCTREAAFEGQRKRAGERLEDEPGHRRVDLLVTPRCRRRPPSLHRRGSTGRAPPRARQGEPERPRCASCRGSPWSPCRRRECSARAAHRRVEVGRRDRRMIGVGADLVGREQRTPRVVGSVLVALCHDRARSAAARGARAPRPRAARAHRAGSPAADRRDHRRGPHAPHGRGRSRGRRSSGR